MIFCEIWVVENVGISGKTIGVDIDGLFSGSICLIFAYGYSYVSLRLRVRGIPPQPLGRFLPKKRFSVNTIMVSVICFCVQFLWLESLEYRAKEGSDEGCPAGNVWCVYPHCLHPHLCLFTLPNIVSSATTARSFHS